MKSGFLSRIPRPKGVFAKLVTVFLVIGLVPFLGMEIWTYQTAKERMTATVMGYWLVRLARETAVQLDREVARMRDLVQGWSRDEVFARDIPHCEAEQGALREAALARLRAYLHNRHKTRREQIDYIFVVDRDGTILADSLAARGGGWASPLAGRRLEEVIPDSGELAWIRSALENPAAPGTKPQDGRLSARDWNRSLLLHRARNGLAARLDEEGPSKNPEDYSLGFAGAVSDPTRGETAGVVAVIFNWRRIQGILDDIQRRFAMGDERDQEGRRYDSGYGFLFAGDRRTIIAHKVVPSAGLPAGHRALLGTDLVADHGLSTFSAAMARREFGHIRYEFPPGTSKISGFAHARGPRQGGFGWYVGVGINDEQIFADVLRLRNLLMVAALIVTGLVILGAAVFSHRITEPITKLIRYTQEVARGNLDARVNVGTRDEIAVLADSFNRMVADLRESNERLIEAEKNAAWQEMARQVAHEIKNPLTPIMLSAQQIRQACRDRHPDQERLVEDSVDSIISQCESLRRIASDFAAFAAFQARPFEETRLDKLLDSILSPYLRQHQQAGIETSFENSVPPGTLVRVDADQVGRALLNLLNNALEAMSEKGGRLAIKVTAAEEEGRPVVRIAISDTGRGIPPEDRAHLFEPYFSTRTGGTGLGLAVCKKIVEGHGGRIEVQSRVSRGTTMTVILPTA